MMNNYHQISVGWVERSETQHQLADQVGFHSSTQPTYTKFGLDSYQSHKTKN
jgi:hypothetical protein